MIKSNKKLARGRTLWNPARFIRVQFYYILGVENDETLFY